MSALELRDVEVSYERKGAPPTRAVAGATLFVDRGEVVGLVGESGCGKSTLARAAVGMVPVSAGQISFEGVPITAIGRRARPAELVRLQMVFQNPYASLNPRRRIGAQIADALRAAGREKASRVPALLEQVGLPPNIASRYPYQFSGGQRQRIAIARALAADPSVIVLDEPLSSLDASAQAQIANLLVALTRDLGVGLLLISHDLAIVRRVAHRVAVMYLGTIVEESKTAELWSSPMHPYTEALIRAVPLADGIGAMPDALAGEVPDPANPPSGCRFHPRCAHAFDRCATDVPRLERLTPSRAAACWLRDGVPGTAAGVRNFASEISSDA